jgi:hypothetical protein
MYLAIVKSEVADRGSDRLADLMARRDSLGAELSRLNRPAETLGKARAALAEAEAELRAHDAADRDARGRPGLLRLPARPLSRAMRLAETSKAGLGSRRLTSAAPNPRSLRSGRGRRRWRRSCGRSASKFTRCASRASWPEVPEIERQILEAHVATGHAERLRSLYEALSQEKTAAENRRDEASATLIQSAMAKVLDPREPKTVSNFASFQASVEGWRARVR